jgi:4-diphosphocytidyl-2-C-methyl-D-erythritol kinase
MDLDVSTNGRRVEVAAPAKINLALLIGPRRPDGFHEICSVMLPVTLSDLVAVERTPGAGLTVDCPVCPGEDNLAARIVRELERRLERTFEVRVTIHKRVPLGAGLGGGSSDAAATLVALERLLALELSDRLRYDVAAVIGSDVPFFLWLGPQLAMGRGQVLKDVALPEPLHIVLALPDLSVSTAHAYGWHDAGEQPALGDFVRRAELLQKNLSTVVLPRQLATLVENDLEAAVVARHPQVAELKRAMLAAGAFAAAMSGSGAAVFGLFDDEAAALTARERLAPARTVYVTDLQPRAQARGEARRPPSSGGGAPRAARPRQDRPQRRPPAPK